MQKLAPSQRKELWYKGFDSFLNPGQRIRLHTPEEYRVFMSGQRTAFIATKTLKQESQ